MSLQTNTNNTPNDNTPIRFGKFKGKPHSFLSEVPKYCTWLVEETKDSFAQDTKKYINQNQFEPRLLSHHKTMYNHLLESKNHRDVNPS